MAADASDRAPAAGAAVLYHYASPPYTRWPELFPALTAQQFFDLIAGVAGQPVPVRARAASPALLAAAGLFSPLPREMRETACQFRAPFRVGAGGLSAGNRVLFTDDCSRRVVGRYWLLIGPCSGLIRRAWLAAIARRARGT